MGKNLNKLGRSFAVFLIVAVAGLIGFVNGAEDTGNIEISIYPEKDVYYVNDEISINFTILPDKNGCYCTVNFQKINGSLETLFMHETGCKSCGTYKPPLKEKITRQIKKKFSETGIYEIEGIIRDAETYKSVDKKIQIFVKDVEKNDKKENDTERKKDNDRDKNDSYFPYVIEVFTRDGCPICYHVDEAVEKLANEYNKKNKNSIIVLEYHLNDGKANQAGYDRRKFYHGENWAEICNYYSLTLINGEDEICGGTHNTENDYLNIKNKIENKNHLSTTKMRMNAYHDNDFLHTSVKIISNETKNLNVFLFIVDDTNVNAYIQKNINVEKNKDVNVNFSFPYNNISLYKNLRIVSVVQEDKRILNARIIGGDEIKRIKEMEKEKDEKGKNETNISKNISHQMNTTNDISIKSNIIDQIMNNQTIAIMDFAYCALNKDMIYCAFRFMLIVSGKNN